MVAGEITKRSAYTNIEQAGQGKDLLAEALTFQIPRGHSKFSLFVGTHGEADITFSGQPLNTETITIAGKVYTFQTVLTDVDGNVLIGASAEATLNNLVAAINLAAGAGTTYAASTTAHATMFAEKRSATVIAAIAILPGVQSLALSNTATNVATEADLTTTDDLLTMKVEFSPDGGVTYYDSATNFVIATMNQVVKQYNDFVGTHVRLTALEATRANVAWYASM